MSVASVTVPRTIRVTTVASALVTVVAGALGGWGSPVWWAVPALAVAVALAETAVVHLQFGRQRWTFSLTEGALGAAFVAGTGGWTALAVVLGVVAAQRHRHQPLPKLAFNAAMFGAATALGSLVAGATGGGTAGAIAGLAAFFVVNHTLVGVAVSATSDRPLLPLLVGSAPLSALHTAGNSSTGLLAAYLAQHSPLGLLGLLVPLALLWSSYDQQTSRSLEARLFAELAEGQERAASRSTDSSARVVVTAAARLLGGADVELLLYAADGAVRYVGDETGVTSRSRVDGAGFGEPWALQALGARGVTAGSDGGRPWCSASLGDSAVLLARRSAEGPHIGRRELALLQVLVGQAEAWLSVSQSSERQRQQASTAEEAARALGDLGARTTPALTVLRESADRLARLAASTGDVDGIVEELHLVERAVASLLGAVALAADPDLLSPPQGVDLPATRPETDWTTTGVLR